MAATGQLTLFAPGQEPAAVAAVSNAISPGNPECVRVAKTAREAVESGTAVLVLFLELRGVTTFGPETLPELKKMRVIDYYVLTDRNFAVLFSPVTEAKLMAYLNAYQKLYGNKFATIITKDYDKKEYDGKRTPPETTAITRVEDGFDVEVVLYNMVHFEAFYKETLHVEQDGKVTKKGERVLKSLGRGSVF
jgi:hypothetical protein